LLPDTSTFGVSSVIPSTTWLLSSNGPYSPYISFEHFPFGDYSIRLPVVTKRKMLEDYTQKNKAHLMKDKSEFETLSIGNVAVAVKL
jgi:hypothetical protein